MTRKLGIAGAALTAVLVSTMFLAGTASAGDTTLDVVVTGGSLSISAQPGSATLSGARFNANNADTATGSFGSIEVTDGRGLTTPWTLTASSTNLVGVTDNTKSIALSATAPMTFQAATVTVGPAGTDGAGTAAGGALTAAGTGVSVATGANTVLATGDVTYSWDPTVTQVVPANTPAQTYRGTVTLTVA